MKLLMHFSILLLLFGCSSPEPAQQIVPKKQNNEESMLLKIKNKNEMLSALIKIATSTYLESNGFGEMREFSIDTNNRSFAFSVDLKGEKLPLRVAVSKYEILKEDGKTYFVAKNIVTDKEWINLAAKKYLHERKIEVPAKYVIFLQLVS